MFSIDHEFIGVDLSTIEYLGFKSLIVKSKEHASFDIRLSFLEEAHLISQPFAFAHIWVHWEMFKLAIEFKQWDEVIGQIPRLALAVPGSWLGKAPKGNVGSTKMGIFEKKES